MEPHLYSAVIRAILNEESEINPSTIVRPGCKKTRARGKQGQPEERPSLALVENLRQLVGGIDPGEHARLVRENDNWVFFLIRISVEAGTRTPLGFALQIGNEDERRGSAEERHFLWHGERPVEIRLRHGRRSILRLFPLPHSSPQLARPSLRPVRSMSPSLLGSSTSSSSGEGLSQSSAAVWNIAARSGALLRRWTGGRGQVQQPLLAVPVRNLATNQPHQLAVPGTLPPVLLHFTLMKVPAVREIGVSASSFQPMEMFEFISVLRNLRDIFLRAWAKKNEVKGNVESGGESEEEGLDELARAFRHFDEATQSTKSLCVTLGEIGHRVARFNEYSPLAEALLNIGVALENCLENGKESTQLAGRLELACADIKGQLDSLVKTARLETEQELKAAVFLAERLVEVLTGLTELAQQRSLFLPQLQPTGQCPSLGLRLADNLAQFEQFAERTRPLVQLVQLPLWAHPAVSGLPATASRLFEKSLQRQLANFVRSHISSAAGADLDTFGDLLDSLQLFLRQSGTQTLDNFFERLCVPYSAKVVQAIDDPLSTACQSMLQNSVGQLRPRDNDELVAFAKSSMRLFCAFGDLSEWSKQLGEFDLQHFELWFERSAVFWAGTWRTVYLEFVRKSVEQSSRLPLLAGPDCPSSSVAESLSPLPPRPLSPEFSHNSSPPPGCAALMPRVSLASSLDFRGESGVQMHEATINFLAFCKALCEDFVRLKASHRSILLLGTLRVNSILASCLDSFCSQLLRQAKDQPTFSKLLLCANGIEHASAYLNQNYERFLEFGRLEDVEMDEGERSQALASCRRMVGCARARCRSIADQIVDSLCRRRLPWIRHCCALITRNWTAAGDGRPLSCYLRQMRTMLRPHALFPQNGRADQLLLFLDKMCAQLHSSLLPRLYATARLALWHNIRLTLCQQLLEGEVPDYYGHVERACESVCHILQLDWAEEHSQLRRTLHANQATSKELILQYYVHLADLTMNVPQQPRAPKPRISLRAGYVRTTGQQVLLLIQVLGALDVPVLDSLTQSSDPYVRLELLPRFLFPLAHFPNMSLPTPLQRAGSNEKRLFSAQTTEVREQTLNPNWNQLFQFALPDELFFTNGVCLGLTLLDHDVMSYNDLAGQAFLPLASLPLVSDLSVRLLPSPLLLPLGLPNSTQHKVEAFRILEQRSGRGDELAREMTAYEKYLRDYRILPPSARDEKESFLGTSLGWGRERIGRLLTSGTEGWGGLRLGRPGRAHQD